VKEKFDLRMFGEDREVKGGLKRKEARKVYKARLKWQSRQVICLEVPTSIAAMEKV
jgi:hypothetical protein